MEHRTVSHDSVKNSAPATRWRSRTVIALAMVGIVVVFYLLREHWNHLFGAWPYLLLLLCPLMHLFSRHGHGHAIGNGNGSRM